MKKKNLDSLSLSPLFLVFLFNGFDLEGVFLSWVLKLYGYNVS